MVAIQISPEGKASPGDGAPRQALLRRRAGLILVCGYAVALCGTWGVAPGRVPALLIAGPVAIALVAVGIRSPLVATALLLTTTFLRLALPHVLFDPFIYAFAGILASAGIWAAARGRNLPALGGLEIIMLAYVLWNVASMIAPHEYPAGAPITVGGDMSVPRFILTGTVMPFAMFLVGRRMLVRPGQVRAVMWMALAAASYSVAVSIMQFYGPRSLVWPRYIVESPSWSDRAVGVFNQPVVNGLVMIIGFVIAMALVHDRGQRNVLRWLAAVLALACAYGIYLTHTRSAWLSFALVIVIGAVFASRLRPGFLLTGATLAVVIAMNWSTFTSSDRAAGGVGSASEVEDRLNTIATSLWAIAEKPWFGWGIGRFAAVNTYHHRQYAPSVPWQRGYGISSHLNDLGIAAELGVFGLALWAAVILIVAVKVIQAWRVLAGPQLHERPLAVVASMALLAQIVTGLTVDLRFFDFPNIVVLLLSGLAIGVAERRGGGATAVGGHPAGMIGGRLEAATGFRVESTVSAVAP